MSTSTPQHLEPEGRGTPRALSPRKKILATSLILLSSLLALTYLSIQLFARLHYHWGGDAMEAKQYADAVQHYEKAARHQPRDGRMHKALGEAFHELSKTHTIQQAFNLEKRAANAFQKASSLIPIDAEAHYGLARSLVRLEQMQAMLHPAEANPYNPLPSFQKALELRPNGILYRYALARHLYRTGDIRAFRSTVQELVRIYPPTYSHLKKEPFWSQPLEPVVEQGLHRAVEAGIMPRAALMALADIHERTGGPLEAVRLYALALQESPRDNQPRHHIHLGRLLLEAGERQQAEQAFMRGLIESTSRESDLSRVFSAFRAHNRSGAFLEFFERADRDIPFSHEARLVTARALMETGSFSEARDLLERLNRRRPTAEAHYLLYRIAKAQKDLDRMELAIQKATVLDPRNSRYHTLFSRVLRRAGKLEEAERAATRALEQSSKPSPGLHHHRATIRRSLNDLSGALSDWNAAMALAPGKAAYHAHAAEALVQLARFDQALGYAAKAAALEPENERYQKRYAKLQKQLEDP